PRLALGARRGAGETRAGEGRGPVVQELAGARVRRAEEHRPGLPALQQILQPLVLRERSLASECKGRAEKRRMSPFARRPSASMAKPAASTARSVSRFGWQPPEILTQNRSSLS